MDKEKARELLASERQRTQRLLAEMAAAGQADRTEANEPGDMLSLIHI